MSHPRARREGASLPLLPFEKTLRLVHANFVKSVKINLVTYEFDKMLFDFHRFHEIRLAQVYPKSKKDGAASHHGAGVRHPLPRLTIIEIDEKR